MFRCDWLVFSSCDWRVSIRAVSVYCFLGGPQSYSSPVVQVVFLVRGHPCFRNIYSTIPVNVVRAKSYVNRLFDPTCVPMKITINKLFFVPNRLWVPASRMSRSCSSILHRTSTVTSFTGNPVHAVGEAAVRFS